MRDEAPVGSNAAGNEQRVTSDESLLLFFETFDVAARSGQEILLDPEAAGGVGDLPLELRFVRDVLVDLHPQVGLAALGEQPSADAGRLAHRRDEVLCDSPA